MSREGDPISVADDMVLVYCYKCGVPMGMPSALNKQRRDDKQSLWCFNGHAQIYAESEADRLRRELNQLKQREAMHEDDKRQLRAQRDAAERAAEEKAKEAAAAHRANARVAKRISRGVCPGCNRTFPDLARHMASKHMGLECAAAQAKAEKKVRTYA